MKLYFTVLPLFVTLLSSCAVLTGEKASKTFADDKQVLCGKYIYDHGDRIIADGVNMKGNDSWSSFSPPLIIRDERSLEYFQSLGTIGTERRIEIVAEPVDPCSKKGNAAACLHAGSKGNGKTAFLFVRPKKDDECCPSIGPVLQCFRSGEMAGHCRLQKYQPDIN